jgi:hypothetical protein
MKMERTEYSETLAFKLQTPGNNPKENIRHSKQGESLKSRICAFVDLDPLAKQNGRFCALFPKPVP